MTKALIRFSLLLFLISFVGLIGLNRALDPRNVMRIQAHDIIIEITSTGSGNTLGFGITATCVPTALAPSDTCNALVGIENTGEGDVTLSAPLLSWTGPLTTCGGGGWFNVTITDLSYIPDTHVVEVGDAETFEVNASLALATPNECQNQTAQIVITITATATEDDDTVVVPSTPAIAPEPVTAPVTPIAQIQGTIATPTPQPTGTPPASPTPLATFTAEVLPSRFPVTGQGGLSDDVESAARVVFAGFGLVAAGLLLLACALHLQRRDAE